MEEAKARQLLSAERARLETLLRETTRAGNEDREAVGDVGDIADPAQPLTDQEAEDAVAAGLRDRLAAVARAEARLAAGTYGRSVRSNEPIPDERLEADPAAELTVEEEGQSASQ
jgi:RNA polymerase-binding transcription factor